MKEAGEWKARIDAIFDEALGLPETDRARYLRQSCDNEPGLREAVEELLQLVAETESGPDFSRLLEGPVVRDLEVSGILAGEARVGPWRIVREVGRGGMATVYLAERADGQYEQRAAFKLMSGSVDHDELTRRFAQERQILALLEHSAIARLLDGGVTPSGSPYLAMEYVEGRPINEFCDEERLTVDERLALFEKVGRAVEYAHRRLIVHRDLKHSNILVTDGGEPKLLDFGIAKLLEPGDTAFSAPETRAAVRLMTPEYASPEQARGEPITTASDVYQLGLLLYELLSGCRAHRFSGRSSAEIERAISRSDSLPPSRALESPTSPTVSTEEIAAARGTTPKRLRKLLGGDLDTIVLKALRPEPGERYNSVARLLDDIERFRSGHPVLARRPTLTYRTTRFVQRHGIGVAAAALVVTSLVAGLLTTSWQARVAARERDRARFEATKADRVVEFLADLFESADPAETLGEDLTARTLLDRGTERLESGLIDQPEVRANLKRVLGRLYGRIGSYETATRLLEEAIEEGRGLHGSEPLDIADSLGELALVLEESGTDVDRRTDALREAVAIRAQWLGPEHPEVASTRSALALTSWSRGDRLEAEAQLDEVLALQRLILAPPHPDLAETLNHLAVVHQSRGDFEAAERYYREALEQTRQLFGENHPSTITVLGNLAGALRSLGRTDDAAAALVSVLERQRVVFGPRHDRVASAASKLALTLAELERFEEAVQLSREAFEIRTEVLGSENGRTILAQLNLGWILHRQGELAAAEDFYREAEDVASRVLPDGTALRGMVGFWLGQLLLETARPAEALPRLREAFETYHEDYGEAHELTLDARIALGGALVELARRAEAEEVLLPVLDLAAAGSTQDRELRRWLATLYE